MVCCAMNLLTFAMTWEVIFILLISEKGALMSFSAIASNEIVNVDLESSERL